MTHYSDGPDNWPVPIPRPADEVYSEAGVTYTPSSRTAKLLGWRMLHYSCAHDSGKVFNDYVYTRPGDEQQALIDHWNRRGSPHWVYTIEPSG